MRVIGMHVIIAFVAALSMLFIAGAVSAYGRRACGVRHIRTRKSDRTGGRMHAVADRLLVIELVRQFGTLLVALVALPVGVSASGMSMWLSATLLVVSGMSLAKVAIVAWALMHDGAEGWFGPCHGIITIASFAMAAGMAFVTWWLVTTPEQGVASSVGACGLLTLWEVGSLLTFVTCWVASHRPMEAAA